MLAKTEGSIRKITRAKQGWGMAQVLAAFLASTRPWFKLQYHKKKKRKGTTSTLKNA
jgi:hypothetical protein